MSTVQLRAVVLGSLAHPEYDYYCLSQQLCPLYGNAVAKREATKCHYVKKCDIMPQMSNCCSTGVYGKMCACSARGRIKHNTLESVFVVLESRK